MLVGANYGGGGGSVWWNFCGSLLSTRKVKLGNYQQALMARSKRWEVYRREKAVVVSCDYLHGLVDSLLGWVFVYRH
jgi:hypothetical protein